MPSVPFPLPAAPTLYLPASPVYDMMRLFQNPRHFCLREGDPAQETSGVPPANRRVEIQARSHDFLLATTFTPPEHPPCKSKVLFKCSNLDQCFPATAAL